MLRLVRYTLKDATGSPELFQVCDGLSRTIPLANAANVLRTHTRYRDYVKTVSDEAIIKILVNRHIYFMPKPALTKTVVAAGKSYADLANQAVEYLI